jgi:F-box protein 9
VLPCFLQQTELLPPTSLQTRATMDSAESNPELESFREQWKAEVRAKHAAPGGSRPQQHPRAAAGPSTPQSHAKPAPRGKPPQPAQKPAAQEQDDDYVQSQPFDEPAAARPPSSHDREQLGRREKAEPVSALEHYERAVEKEAAGNLGDSLKLYRKAFRVRCAQCSDTDET